MRGLDFWATDAHTDSVLPIFDQWSIEFSLSEWTREVMRDEMLLALRIKIDTAYAEAQTRPGYG